MERDRYNKEDDDGGFYSDELDQNDRYRNKKQKSSRVEEKEHRNHSKRKNTDEVLKEREKEYYSLEKDRILLSSRKRRKDDRDSKVREKVKEKEKDEERARQSKKEIRDREKKAKERSRKLEVEKEKALQLSKTFEEQDNHIQEEISHEELRKRLQGASTNNCVQDLNLNAGKISSDYYYTQEEIMLQFKTSKEKNKFFRKKCKLENLDIDAHEAAEAISAGLGADARRRQAIIREEELKTESEKRNIKAYQLAYAKNDEIEASKSLSYFRQTVIVKPDDGDHEIENQVFDDDKEDLYKSLERAKKSARKIQEEEKSGPQAIAVLATTVVSGNPSAEDQSTTTGEGEKGLVFTEMGEFVMGLQLDEETHKPKTKSEDVFMDEKSDDEIVSDETIHEVAVGKGLSGALKLLKDRGMLKDDQSIECGGSRKMDEKKSKEAFREFCHKFHGKSPGKTKEEKRKHRKELWLKRMENSSDTLPPSVQMMMEAQAHLKTPYIVLSGKVKPVTSFKIDKNG